MQNKISKEIKDALDVMGYHTLLPIQEKVIPHLLAKQNVIVKAKTGSGKTAAFGVPVCENIVWEYKQPQVIVLTCTRELAMQIKQELSEIGRLKKIKVVPIIGKENMTYQKDALAQKCHVVVATPGRLLDHIQQGNIDLSKVAYVIIDEADFMLNLGFVEDVEEIMDNIDSEYTTALFSATFPERIEQLIDKVIQAPIRIAIEDKANICYRYKMVDDKLEGLIAVLETQDIQSAIIFCNLQEEVDDVSKQLAQRGLQVAKIHGGMRQKDRFSQMQLFKQGKRRILVATDVAARGIDIDRVSHVIHYALAKCEDDFIHRCGRSARNDASGDSIMLIEPRQRNRFINQLLDQYDMEELVEETSKQSIHTLNKSVEKKNHEDKWKESVCKLYFSIGKEKKIRAIDIVGALCSIDGISQADIGVISILAKMSYVEILNGKEELIVAAFQQKTIKNKKVKVEIAN